MRIEKVDLNKIFVDTTQPRKTFNKTELQSLASSILKRGLLEPLKVIKLKEGFMLIDGERRFRALNILVKSYKDEESKKVNCIIINKLKEKTLTQLTYDIQKEKIPHLEEGEAYKKLIQEEGYSVQDLSTALGKRKGYILSKLKLTAFNENTKRLIRNGDLPAQALYSIDINKSKEAEDRIVDRIRKERPGYGEVRKIIAEETKDKEELCNRFLKDAINFKRKIWRFENKYQNILKKPDFSIFENQEIGNIVTELEKLQRNLDILELIKKESKNIVNEIKEIQHNYGNEKEFTSELINKKLRIRGNDKKK